VGIDENIWVDENHLKPSPSTAATLSLILSMLGSRSRPKSTLCVLNGSLSDTVEGLTDLPEILASIATAENFP